MKWVVIVSITIVLLLCLAGCQRAISPQQVILQDWTSDFSAGNAEKVHLRNDGTIIFSIESEPGGPEYLWFNLKVA
ncbi:hypothetical protein KJ564_07610, partial [bacterium]|nr:hypothetical protein [bacterium]